MASTAAAAAAATAKAATTATTPPTDEAWKVAQKLRAAIHKELELIQNGGPGKNELARFEKVEKLMENYRLACIETIWPDIRAAKEKGAEDALWQTHTQVTKAYRKVLARLQGHDNAVLRRKVERLYSTYLKTAQYFYKGYLQRVCARYDMKDLKRIARQAELEEMPVPDADKVDPEAAHVEEIVKASCHKMLIYLGDLSRYRTLMRPKDRKWDVALTYYLLANELIPESGYGHHQCGVIHVEREDHLEVVYHLYRALACDMPHPNAPNNLKREFNDLQKRKSTGIKHALVNWFLKLHAFYFQGKEFAERKELESEVDHRLAVSMKTGTGLGSDKDLLKIILINISAYVAAQQKTRAEWTEEGSLSCQFILLLNIRTIQAISRLLGDEITDLIQHNKPIENPAKKANSTAQAESSSKFTPAFSRVLPLLRVYMAWLCSYGSSDLVEFRPYLEPHFGAMCTTLSNTITLLFELLGGDTKLGNTVSWRFPEDEMTLGLNCLNGSSLHDGCQLCYDAFTHKPKPRLEDVSDANYTADDVTFTRALDVAFCALDLSAPESKFPLITSTTTKGSRELTTVVYLEGGKPDPTLSVPAYQHQDPDNSGGLAAMPPAAPAAFEQSPGRPVISPSPCESNELSEDEEFYGPSLRRGSSIAHHTQARPVVAASQAPQAAQPTPTSEFPIEKQLFQILNDFMSPPESVATKPETPTRLPAPMASYGMGSAAAADPTSTSPGPGSGTKTFPTLPWNYFYNPAPVGTASGWGGDSSGSSRPVSSGSAAQLRAGATAANPLSYQTHSRSDSQGQRALLDKQAEALRSLNLGPNFSDHVSQPLQSYDARGLWPAAANPARQNIWEPSASPWRTSQGQYSTADRVPNSPFSTLDFSSNTSSLPPVNSPWGLAAASRRYGSQGGPSASSPNPLRAHPSLNQPDDAYYAAMVGEHDARARTPLGPWAHARMASSTANQPLQGGDT